MKTKILIPLAGLALFCACKGRGKYEVANYGTTADSAEVATDTVQNPKLVKTAALNFKVKNVRQTSDSLTKLTTGYGGMVMHEHIGSTTGNNEDYRVSSDSIMKVTSFETMADMTVKVPFIKLTEFMAKTAAMGIHVDEQNMDVDDKSLDYLSASLKLKNRSDLVKAQKSGKVIIKKPEEVINLKDDMTDEQIDNRRIDDAVKNSIVSLKFYQSNTIGKEMVADDDPGDYKPSFFKRAEMAIENGYRLFADAIVGLLNCWMFIAVGIGGWLLLRHYKGKGKPGVIKAG